MGLTSASDLSTLAMEGSFCSGLCVVLALTTLEAHIDLSSDFVIPPTF